MKKRVVIVAVALLALGVCQAQALPVVIHFGPGDAPTAGVVTKAGSLYTGDGILLPMMQLINTPLNHDRYLTDAVLSFGYDGGQTNWVEVTGGFAPAEIEGGSVLLAGSFTDFHVTGTSFGIFVQGAGADTMHPLLLAFAGLGLDTPFELFGMSMAVRTSHPGVYDAFSTGIANTAIPSVPDPGSTLLLFGMGLAGLAAIKRRCG